MANMCEVSVKLYILRNNIRIDKLDSLVKDIGDTIPPGDSAAILVEETETEVNAVTIRGYTSWWLHPEEAVNVINYISDHFDLDLEDIQVVIRYLERGFNVCGKYVAKNCKLYMGDIDSKVWEELKSIDVYNASDKDWDHYWDTLYSAQSSVELHEVYDFKTKVLKDE